MTAQSITVTLNSKPLFETVRMRAEDTARKLLVTIVDTNSQPVDLTNLTVEFRAKRPDGTEITYTEQVEMQDSVILIGPTPLQKAIEVPGIVLCELLLYGIAGYIGTATWEINAWLPAVRNAGQQSTSDFQSAVEAAVVAVAAAERAEAAASDAVQYSSHPAEIRDGYWWTWNAATGVMENSGQLAQGADGKIQEIIPGDNIDVDDTDPARPIVASTGGGTGDMLKSDYDPSGSVLDAGGIPAYVESQAGKVFNAIYPIGSIYMSTNDVNPSALFGGVWESWGAGRVPLGVDVADENFASAELTGGTKEQAYALSGGNARAAFTVSGGIASFQDVAATWTRTTTFAASNLASASGAQTRGIAVNGATNAGNNLQPYITCYMWKRTA